MKLFCLFHQAQCFTVSFRVRHSEITHNILFCRCTFLLSDYSHRLFPKKCDTAHDCTVITVRPVTMQFIKIFGEISDIVKRRRTFAASCNLHLFPCRQLLLFIFCRQQCFFFFNINFFCIYVI